MSFLTVMNWLNVLILCYCLKVAKYGSFNNGLQRRTAMDTLSQRLLDLYITATVARKENYPQISIAERISKHRSVVSRELQHNRDLRSNTNQI